VTQARYLIIGSGSIGRRHLRNLRSLRPDAGIALLRRRESATDDKPDGCDLVIHGWSDALAFRADAAVIASPAPFHAQAARSLLQSGTSVLIEKPLAASYAEAEELSRCVALGGAVAVVGYNLRFEPGVLAFREMLREGAAGRPLVARGYVGQYLPDWRPDVDYRMAVSGRAALGGGPLLELSHEIDLACWLFGLPDVVHCVGGKYSALEVDVEDAVELTLEYSDPARLVTLGLNFLERTPARRFDVVGSEGTLRWDGISRRLTLTGAVGSQVSDHSENDRNAAYMAELKHFLACAAGLEKPAVTIQDGMNVLAVIEAARKSMQTGAGQRTGETI
jgi:predicted dehydrogenase